MKALRALPADRRRNVLRLWIASGGRTLPDARRLEEIAGPLIDARADAHPRVEWPLSGRPRRQARRITVIRHADLLSLAEREPVLDSGHGDAARLGLAAVGRCALPDGGALELTPERHGPIDLDALPARLAVTWRRGGEQLRVRRGGPRRALKSLLQEAHVPLAERARLPLLLAEGAVIAAADLWIDESVRASARGAASRPSPLAQASL